MERGEERNEIGREEERRCRDTGKVARAEGGDVGEWRETSGETGRNTDGMEANTKMRREEKVKIGRVQEEETVEGDGGREGETVRRRGGRAGRMEERRCEVIDDKRRRGQEKTRLGCSRRKEDGGKIRE